MPCLIIRLYGIVQGVGFRPFVARTARSMGVLGTVANKGSCVEIFAQGEKEVLDRFVYAVKNRAPERAAVISADVRQVKDKSFDSFEIIQSEKEEGAIFVSPDIATCDKCRRELFDKNDRRYLHPFINCTQCGPRLTILEAMPYDRERTTMKSFPMCPDCEYEYTHAHTRRYDAQPVCCNDCGPQVYIVHRDIKGGDAITYARKSIMEGKIIAVKGIGGFHLCCDAANEQSVDRLRKLKNRPAKPFAVMMKDMDTVERECHVLEGQKEYLTGYQKPILLLEKKEEGELCPGVSPDNPTVGVMLPYAPVQMLLFDYPDEVKMTDCLVMTSGNVSGAPICRNDEDAQKQIGSYCDLILSHNREILIRADDSVMDWFDGKPYMIRRSRGFAPLPVMVSMEKEVTSLAIGGELKNTFCIGKNRLLYLSSYVGDMADIRTVNALKESVGRMQELLEARPTICVCDMHPKYNTVTVAQETGLPLVRLQHHYAHILSCMAENDCDEKVIGVSFDGTGYGTDGTIWGGEILVCDTHGFERAASIKPFRQVGGDASSKEGWRIAVQLIRDSWGEKAQKICSELGICDEKTFKLQSVMADKGINTVRSTSAGRLFDAVSAILGIKRSSTFEGESSMSLEFAAERFEKQQAECEKTAVHINGSGFETIDTTSLAGEIARRFIDGESADKLAFVFHTSLADGIVRCCESISRKTGVKKCALSGGVFQNKLLLRLVNQQLRELGFEVLIHSLVPANDGGIALGQAYYALCNCNNE
ncbi:MAG: carbamoyltransferase HypF [Ruminococcus sp.]|nr:carbamoyltransferase HypF [Ruminococcus sp.]